MPLSICHAGNGIVLETESRKYRFDPVRTVVGDENFVSHAHSDHVPRRFDEVQVACSDATFDLIGLRRRSLQRISSDGVTLVEAGHVPGSRMVALDCGTKVLYTGDFCTRRKYHIDQAKPQPCDVLVMETTYGREGYEFPDHGEIIGEIADWVDSTMASGRSVVLLAYPLGKAQELAHALLGRPVRVQRSIGDNNRVLAAHGPQLPTECLEGSSQGEPIIYITSGLGKESSVVENLVRDGARTASFSGWSTNAFSGRSWGHADEEFQLSDHCDYNELMEFVRLCSPGRVLTTHGFATEFAASVRTELGIEASALQKGQSVLDSFA